MNVENRTIFQGDNLHILRGLDSETIDLIYLDPPFNSNRTYAAPIGSVAAGAAFKDSWTLSDLDNAWHGQLAEREPGLYAAISAAAFAHGPSMKAYLIMMGIRMLEMRRVLKETGSIYLHCDPTASHYLKVVMDAVFGQQNFRNEIVWHYDGPQRPSTKNFGKKHDTLLRFAKSDKFFANPDGIAPLRELSQEELSQYKKTEDGRYYYDLPRGSYTDRSIERLDREGRIRWTKSGKPRVMFALNKNNRGNYCRKKQLHDVWADVSSLGQVSAKEKTGYPTQKPLKLLQRIILASSNRGDIVLDPFCGCATTCIAAESLQRQWIGIDISPKAIELLKLRLERDLNLTENTGILGQVIHRKTPPKRTDPPEPRQIHFETLFGVKDKSMLETLSQRDLRRFKTHKHVLFGMQEGKCAGCQVSFHFRNITIDHIQPRSKGGSDGLENLQLLCQACNSTKGNRTQAELIQSLLEQGVLRD